MESAKALCHVNEIASEWHFQQHVSQLDAGNMHVLLRTTCRAPGFLMGTGKMQKSGKEGKKKKPSMSVKARSAESNSVQKESPKARGRWMFLMENRDGCWCLFWWKLKEGMLQITSEATTWCDATKKKKKKKKERKKQRNKEKEAHGLPLRFYKNELRH